MRDNQPYRNRLLVSAQNQERAINNEQMLDTMFELATGDIMDIRRRTFQMPVLAGGASESEHTYYQGYEVELGITKDQAQPQHVAFAAAFALGDITTEANGGNGPANGYHHTIVPLDSPLDAGRPRPTFTAVQRVGMTLEQRLGVSLLINQLTFSASKDDFCKLSATCQGTGKTQSSVHTEQVAGNSDDATITLAANAVEGASASARLDSVSEVSFKLASGGGWQDVQLTAVSAAIPAELAITAPDNSGANAGAYRIRYAPDHATALATGSATSDPAWDHPNATTTLTDTAAAMTAGEHLGRYLVMTSGTASGAIFMITGNSTTAFSFENYDLYSAGVRSGDTYDVKQFPWADTGALSQISQPYLRMNDLTVVVGGEYDGSSFTGGRTLAGGLNSIEWSYSGNHDFSFLAGDGQYTSSIGIGQAEQTLKLDQRMKEAVYRAMMADAGGDFDDEADYFAMQVTATGAEIGGGYNFQVRITWPRLAINSVKLKAEEAHLGEDLELAVKAHPTHGSVVVEIWDNVASYAA